MVVHSDLPSRIVRFSGPWNDSANSGGPAAGVGGSTHARAHRHAPSGWAVGVIGIRRYSAIGFSRGSAVCLSGRF